MASAIDIGHNAPAGTKMSQKTKQSSGSHSFSPDEFEELGKKELEKELQGHGWCCSSPEMREYYETAVLEGIGKFVLKWPPSVNLQSCEIDSLVAIAYIGCSLKWLRGNMQRAQKDFHGTDRVFRILRCILRQLQGTCHPDYVWSWSCACVYVSINEKLPNENWSVPVLLCPTRSLATGGKETSPHCLKWKNSWGRCETTWKKYRLRYWCSPSSCSCVPSLARRREHETYSLCTRSNRRITCALLCLFLALPVGVASLSLVVRHCKDSGNLR